LARIERVAAEKRREIAQRTTEELAAAMFGEVPRDV